MARTDGHVHGLEPWVNGWLAEQFMEGDFSPSIPAPGHIMPCWVRNPIIGYPYGEDRELAISYELLERAGNIALWRITNIDVIVLAPNPVGDPIPVLCGSLDYYVDSIVPGASPTTPGWGEDPACPINFWQLPAYADLLFLTLSNVSYNDRMRSMGAEYVIAIQDNTTGSTLLRDRWKVVLMNARVDEVEWADEAVVQITALAAPGMGNYQVVGERAV